MKALGEKIFSEQELQWFAVASGDCNPIHVNATAARRLIAGSLVTHGMFTTLYALEFYAKAGGPCPARMAAYFQKPVVVGEKLAFFSEEKDGEVRVVAKRGEEEVASIRLISAGEPASGAPKDARPKKGTPKEYVFAQTKGLSGMVDVCAAKEDIAAKFPHSNDVFGAWAVAGVMAFSRIIGMECPGLHSLFTGFDVTLGEVNSEVMRWEVTRHLSPYAPLQLRIGGAGFEGTLDAIVRPEPVAQPGMAEVKTLMEAGSIAGERVLVVGGSRGLGEIVAKCVASAGAEVLITYAHGKDDAQKVAEEIHAAGGACWTEKLDVTSEEERCALLERFSPTQLYYFATPRIVAGDADVKRYEAVYVEAFGALVRAAGKGTLRVFYPSSVFVDEKPKGFEAYAVAKLAGEKACAGLMSENSSIQIIISRLPRMKTDQTASLMPVATKPALQEMVGVIRQMQALKN